MNDLPDLAFEKVLACLDLKEMIMARAVSKRFYFKIDQFRVNSLCYSEMDSCGFIKNQHRLIVGEFAKNFIGSPEFESFFANFGRSILSNLRHLRVCDLNLKDKALEFFGIVNSFKKLESLILTEVFGNKFMLGSDLKLNLPNLRTIRFDHTNRFVLTLDAPKLTTI